jgi:hypothetical protein
MESQQHAIDSQLYTHEKSFVYREKTTHLRRIQGTNPGNLQNFKSSMDYKSLEFDVCHNDISIHGHGQNYINSLRSFDCKQLGIHMQIIPIPVATINGESALYFSNTFLGLPAPALFQKNKQRSFSIEAILETRRQLDQLKKIWSNPSPVFKEKARELDITNQSKEYCQHPLDNKHKHKNKNQKNYGYIYRPVKKNDFQSTGTETNKRFIDNSFTEKPQAIESPSHEEPLEKVITQLQKTEQEIKQQQESIQKEFIQQDEGICLFEKINTLIPAQTPKKEPKRIQLSMTINNPEDIPMEVKTEQIEQNEETKSIEYQPVIINNQRSKNNIQILEWESSGIIIQMEDRIKDFKKKHKRHYKKSELCNNQ